MMERCEGVSKYLCKLNSRLTVIKTFLFRNILFLLRLLFIKNEAYIFVSTKQEYKEAVRALL